MNRILPLCCLLLACCVARQGLAASPYYVAPTGNDAWSGTLAEANEDGTDGPFATVQRAVEATKDAGGGAIFLREGVYELSTPIRFGPEHAGTEESPLILQRYKRERVRLLGGPRLGEFKPYSGSILQCRLEKLQHAPGQHQLFVNGARMPLARWPNVSTDPAGIPGGEWTFIAGAVDAARSQKFLYSGEVPGQWKHIDGLQVSIWPNYNWWQTIVKVTAIDPATGTVTLEKALPYTIEPGRRLIYQNLLELLDAPGEWFLDQSANTLYLWPPDDAKDPEVVLPALSHLIELEDTAHVNLIGLVLEASVDDAVIVKNSVACLVAACRIYNVGGYGVSVNGGEKVRVLGNDIAHTGRGGISLSGGDRPTLTRGNHEAGNNHIRNFSEIWQTYNPGISINGVGHHVHHNLIHDAPHAGILLTGNDHLIEFNDIHHVCMEGGDNGAFYMGRDWTQRGNILRHNAFHDVYGFGLVSARDGKAVYAAPHQAWGVYLDDCSSGTQVIGNLFYRVPLCGVMIGGGRDNLVKNNVFYECIPALHIDARWDEYPWEIMRERYDAMNASQPPYSERYPELADLGDDPRKPANNQFLRNVIYYSYDDFAGLTSTAERKGAAVVYNLDQFDPESTVINENVIDHGGFPVRIHWSVYKDPKSGRILDWQQWKEQGYDIDSRLADANFVAPKRDDFRLRPNSAAFLNNFEQIPTHQIGLYRDEFRATWPVERDTRREGVAHREWTVEIPPPNAPVGRLSQATLPAAPNTTPRP